MSNLSDKLISLTIVSSEEEIFSSMVRFCVLPAIEGEVCIYPNHIPLITKLNPGVVKVALSDQTDEKLFCISGGFLEVQANAITVLSDVVERSDQLDEMRLIEQKNLALSKLRQSNSDTNKQDLDMIIAQLKAIERIKASSGAKNK